MMIDIRTFGGLTPSTGRHLLQGDGAAEAVNCRLGSGELRPLARMKRDHILPCKGAMFRWHGTWLHYTDAGRRFVPGPVYGEDQRLYMTGAAGGAVVYTTVTNEKKLGVKEPGSKPTVCIRGSRCHAFQHLPCLYLHTGIRTRRRRTALPRFGRRHITDRTECYN